MGYAASNNNNDTKAKALSKKEQTNIFVLIPICLDILVLSELFAEGVAKTCHDFITLKMKFPYNIVIILIYNISSQKAGYHKENIS